MESQAKTQVVFQAKTQAKFFLLNWAPDKNALRGTLVENMKEIRPTQFLGVPRVWEKMQEKMMEVGIF